MPAREKERRKAPDDAACAEAWKRIMRIASEHCLIVQSYGGVAVLAMPEEQRKNGLRQAALDAQVAEESRDAVR